MTTPTIADLPIATVANNTDQLVMRQPAGALGIDKSVTAALLRTINISLLPSLPSSALSSDFFMIDRAGINYKIRHDQVSFVKGTKMWFYQNVAPDGWTIFESKDTLLAVKGDIADVYNTGGGNGGNWLQEGHALVIEEIAPHRHRTLKTKASTNSSNTLGPKRGITSEDSSNEARKFSTSDTTGGSGSTENIGLGNPALEHNHGDTWRPKASVGIICVKD